MDENLNPYEFKEIIIAGSPMMARPIEWNGQIIDNEGHLENGIMATPVTFETTCHSCAQLVTFQTEMISVRCPHCGSGYDEREPDYSFNVSDIIVNNDADADNNDADDGDKSDIDREVSNFLRQVLGD